MSTDKTLNAALSAQPSPGGQGDALKALDDLAAFCSDDTATVDRHVAVIRAALAARQPVGEIDEAAVLRRAAAVLYMWEDDPNLTGYMGDFKDACGILELLAQHAAPPAQAVDLGELRRLSDSWLARSEKLSVTQQRKAGAYWACAKELRDWLDSQAVGK
ncbi:hypothetical protein [Stenotrophomonas pavanii]|uniref:hypothetical protein n=1 Tax=Stenotrophomonas pavanii TaxID=487698 RepID=UPI0039C756EA